MVCAVVLWKLCGLSLCAVVCADLFLISVVIFLWGAF